MSIPSLSPIRLKRPDRQGYNLGRPPVESYAAERESSRLAHSKFLDGWYHSDG